MTDYEEVVEGTIVHREGGAPVAGAVVRVYDKDLLADDHLGTAETDTSGRFQVRFGWSQFKDSVFESRPDVFVEVVNPETGKTTRSKVFEELRGKLSSDEVETMDLGRIEVD